MKKLIFKIPNHLIFRGGGIAICSNFSNNEFKL